MASQESLDELFLDLTDRIAMESKAVRLKVGALLEKDGNIVAFGWNGTPPGADNCCEIINPDGSLTTKPNVIHAEPNAYDKLGRQGSVSTVGTTLYTRYSPCVPCCNRIASAKTKRVVFRELYRDLSGLDILREAGVEICHLPKK